MNLNKTNQNFSEKLRQFFINLMNKNHRVNKQEIDNIPLEIHEFRLMSMIGDIEIENNALHDYKMHVKNNTHDSKDIVIKKLVRNMILGNLVDYDTEYNEIFEYGNMLIKYNRKSKIIVDILNRKGIYKFDIDMKKKQWIDCYWGL